MNARRTLLTAGLVAAVLVLGGCTSPTEAAPQPTPSGSSAPQPTGSEQPSAEPTKAADPTCETILPEATVSDFAEIGWAPIQEPFLVGSQELTGGILCKWGDPKVASDHVQIYGWAPITASQAGDAQVDLVAGGWIREDGPEGVYITESSETATATDDQGYGWTYLFGDGWVKFADTKQGILLVEWSAG